MTTAKHITDPTNGLRYERKESGYCYCNGNRISRKDFEEAEIEILRKQQERNSNILNSIHEAETENQEENMNIIEIDGTKWGKDIDGKTYRDGTECSESEFNEAMGIGKTSKERKVRRSKDISFDHNGITLTAKQEDFLRELDAAGQDGVLGTADTGWWVDCIADGIGGQFAGKPMTVGAMISTLCEKGLGNRSKDKRETGNGRTRKVTTFNLTDAGRDMWKAMGLK